jgi:hypothetical protein
LKPQFALIKLEYPIKPSLSSSEMEQAFQGKEAAERPEMLNVILID